MMEKGENFYGTKAGFYPELFGVLTNPTSPQAWLQLALHRWDISEAERAYNDAVSVLTSNFNGVRRIISDFVGKSPSDVVASSYNKLNDYAIWRVRMEKELLINGKDFPMSSSVKRLTYNFVDYITFSDAFKGAGLNLPAEYGILIPAERYWKSYFRTARFGIKDSFVMWKKGLLGIDYLKSVLREDVGIPEQHIDSYIKHLDYDPSPGELIRMSRTINPPASWVEKKLKNFGIGDEDLSYYKSWISREPIKDELERNWGAIATQYSYGFMNEMELKAWLSRSEFSPAEQELRLEYAKLLRNKYKVAILRDREIYLYRNGKRTENELYENLKSIGIDDEIANALTALEAARKGIIWEAPS
jgi:hypothetical protein